jgi:hypothetical protein
MSVESQSWSTTSEHAKVKKEQFELIGDCHLVADTRLQLQQKHSPPPLRLNNGFHSGDLLQDILKTSKNSLAYHTPAAKHEKIRLMIEDSIR